MIKKRIIHLADIQIEARNSGEGNRYDEFKSSLEDSLLRFISDKPDMFVLTGDLFEYNAPTEAERSLFSWYLRELSKICTVVITNGNHDLAQKNNELIINYKNQVKPDSIETVLDAMDIPNIRYLKRTGFYNVDGITFAVWGHYEKFNKVKDDQRPYSPWELEEASKHDPRHVIELFHDPVQNCKGFDGKSEISFLNYKIKVTDFKSPLVLAGDIHNPDIIEFGNNQTFTYCSSLVMRNYGEGNYYNNGIPTQRGNDKHGYNIVNYSLDGDTVQKDVKFIQLKPRVTRHTITLGSKFDYNNIEMVSIISSEFNHIRFKVDDKVNEFFDNQDKLYDYLRTTCECTFDEPVFDKDVGVSFDDDYTIDSVESIINSDKVVDMSNLYIEKAVDKTRTIGKEDKEDAKNMLKGIFKKAFVSAGDLTTNIKTVSVSKIIMNNSLTFSDNVVVEFDNVGNIVRVTGANAVGKTKIFTVIGYMFTDLLHADQKATQHKNNRLELFNYTRPNDVVKNEMHFTVNGKEHILKKVVERTWKKKVNMWHDKDWKDYIVGTPSLEIELSISDGTVITDYDSVMSYMRDLISFDDFYRHIFVNQRSLENLLKMKSENLITEILHIIGLNFFDTLLEKYDDVKDRIMDNLTKPSGTIESLLSDIAKSKGVIEKCDIRDNEIDLDLKENTENKEFLKKEIKELKDSVGNVRKLSEVNIDIETKTTEKSNKNIRLEELKVIVSEGQKFIDSINLDEIETKKASISVVKESLITKNAELQTTLDNIEKELDNKQKEIDTFIQLKKNDKQKSKNNINSVINEFNTSINKHNERLVEIKNIIASNLKKKKEANDLVVSEHQKDYDNKKALYDTKEVLVNKLAEELSTLNTKVNNIRLTIETLKSSDKCDSCGEYTSNRIKDKISIEEVGLDKMISDRDNKKEEHAKHLQEFNGTIKASKDISFNKLNASKEVVVSHTIADEPELKTEVQTIAKDIKNIKELVSEKQKDIVAIDTDKSYLSDSYILERKSEIENSDKTKKDLNARINDGKESIKEQNNIITSLESNVKERSEKELVVVTNKGYIKGCLKDIEILDKELLVLDKELGLSKGVSKVHETIESKENFMQTYLDTDKTLENEKIRNKYTKDESNKNITSCEKDIEALKKYTLTSAVVKQYKTMLGKNGLQKYIFGKIVDILNSKLSILLENVSMRLFFDKDSLDLRKHDLKKNILSGVQMASGMESSILGLSLLKALKSLNQIRKFNILMIDEISGQFNDGTGLTYKAYNYQDLFTKLLLKIKDDTCVYVVDHVIKDLGETSTLEVELTPNGSVINLK